MRIWIIIWSTLISGFLLIVSQSSLIITQVRITVPTEIAFSLSLPPDTEMIKFLPSSATEFNVSAQNQTIHQPILIFSNQGNIMLSWSIRLNQSLPPGQWIKYSNISDLGSAQYFSIDPVKVNHSIPIGGQEALWLWMDFQGAAAGEYYRILISEASQAS